jgi:predicted nucleic acid-binding Zn ribbon protein
VASASPPPCDDDDPWTSARGVARGEVAAALAPRRRICPACGHEQEDTSRTCSACGADLVARRRSRRVRRRTVAAALLGLLAAVALVIAVTGPLRRQAADETRRATARQEALEAAEIRRLRADAQPHRATGRPLRRGDDALAHRRALVRRTEALITRDARARVRAGTLAGPIAGTACEPYPGISDRRRDEADPAFPVGRYECIAYRGRVALPELEGVKRQGVLGYPFWAVIDYGPARMAWCKVTPRAGEGGRSLESVPVPVPCRDPARRSP